MDKADFNKLRSGLNGLKLEVRILEGLLSRTKNQQTEYKERFNSLQLRKKDETIPTKEDMESVLSLLKKWTQENEEYKNGGWKTAFSEWPSGRKSAIITDRIRDVSVDVNECFDVTKWNRLSNPIYQILRDRLLPVCLLIDQTLSKLEPDPLRFQGMTVAEKVRAERRWMVGSRQDGFWRKNAASLHLSLRRDDGSPVWDPTTSLKAVVRTLIHYVGRDSAKGNQGTRSSPAFSLTKGSLSSFIFFLLISLSLLPVNPILPFVVLTAVASLSLGRQPELSSYLHLNLDALSHSTGEPLSPIDHPDVPSNALLLLSTSPDSFSNNDAAKLDPLPVREFHRALAVVIQVLRIILKDPSTPTDAVHAFKGACLIAISFDVVQAARHRQAHVQGKVVSWERVVEETWMGHLNPGKESLGILKEIARKTFESRDSQPSTDLIFQK
ncbi:hypothetical protein BDY24DRAFT_370268 [Mrakia frigida]|uniref:uncharacterized protein n=1 Tax=Mrakia frigida TaxID=29902 RepID=UPI003FCBEFFF